MTEPAASAIAEPREVDRRWLVWVLAAALVVSVLGVVWLAVTRPPSTPGDGSVAAGFSRDMAAHHEQAVAMAEIIRDRTEDAAIRLLATDIALTQQSQIGRMRGWLDVWGLRPTGSTSRMAWMGEPTTGLMPGMAAATDVERLRSAPLADAENLFLSLMIEHHRAGVAMAQAALDSSVPAEVATLARGIVTSQSSEIETLQRMLADRGQAAPEISGTAPNSMDDDHGGG